LIEKGLAISMPQSGGKTHRMKEGAMEFPWILSPPEYYARMNAYILEFGLPYSVEEDIEKCEETAQYLKEILGDAQGQSILDCTCGWGTQAIPLARLGWRVTACDISETSMDLARKYALRQDVKVEFRVCDMRALDHEFNQQFDWVISSGALHEIPTEEGILQALKGMFSALKPGGKIFLEFKDTTEYLGEPLMRHFFSGEKRIPNGRIICIDDWEYESEETVIVMDAFLREDDRYAPSEYGRWRTETIGVRKRIIRKTAILRLLRSAGFDPVSFLSKPEVWHPYRIIATRPV
jgi:glycine/sarcosine N-methyltransferase